MIVHGGRKMMTARGGERRTTTIVRGAMRTTGQRGGGRMTMTTGRDQSGGRDSGSGMALQSGLSREWRSDAVLLFICKAAPATTRIEDAVQPQWHRPCVQNGPVTGGVRLTCLSQGKRC
jgi:hypothetical protein